MALSRTYIPKLNPEFIARSLHLVIPGNQNRSNQPFSFVTTDSRHARPGCLFVALKGDKMDGHDYIDIAISQGARGVLCKRGTPIKDTSEISLFPVEDSLNAYRRLAAAWRKEFSVPMVAVAGSVGKTTTKEMLAALLRGKFDRILKTEGSQNGFIGIPMTLLGLTPEHQVAVVEVGIDEPDAMAQHIALVHPTHALLTTISEEHLERLRDIPTVAHEEGEALRLTAHLGGTAIINMDDAWIRPHHQTLRVGKQVLFSLNTTGLQGITSSEKTQTLQGSFSEASNELTVRGMQVGELVLKLPLIGRHNALNLLAAVSAAAALGLSGEEIKKGLATFQGAYGRSELQQAGKSPVLCDYYNANPSSMKAGLESLAHLAKGAPRWACLGDMLELGPAENDYHRNLADPIMELGIENVLLYGERMKVLFDELSKRGFAGQAKHFDTHEALAESLKKEAQAGHPILIKGSRSMKMEEVWKILEPYAKSHWA